jgi:hypothetical protein
VLLLALALVALAGLAGLAWHAGLFGTSLSPAERAELDEVYRRLTAGYRTDRVFVQWKSTTRLSVPHGLTRSRPHLAIRMTDPPFLRDVALEKAEPHAREIAYVARNGLADPAKAPVVEVQLVQALGAGTNVRRHRRFLFRADEIGGS